MNQRPNQLVWYPGHDLLVADIVRADNCHLFDTDGKRYVDLESGVWCTTIGHGHPEVLRTMAEQAAQIAHTGFNYASAIVESAARSILSLLSFDDGRCVFLCSGSEAVEYGVRTAQTVINRPLILTMADSYFGAYGAASQKPSEQWAIFDWAPCAACPYPGECGGQCEHWGALPLEDIGGFLFEPGSSSGLVRFPPGKLVRSLVAALRQNDGLVLVNEVTTGIGRTGRWFGYQHYGIEPDIVALGKGIGNGYPVSVSAFAPGVIDRLGGKPVKYAQSHQNDPLGAAVARKVIDIIAEEKLIERGRAIGDWLFSGLQRIGERTGRIGGLRSRGLMTAVELIDDAQSSCTKRVQRELTKRGFIVGRRPDVNVLRLDPSLTIDENDIARFLDTLEEVLATV